MVIVEVKRGLNQPAYITSWSQRDVCFYPFRKRRSAQQGSYLNSNKPQQKRTMPTPHSWLWLHGRMRSVPLPLQHTNTAMLLLLFLLAHATDSLRHTISWAASFRLIWIFMNVVRRPHSIIGEIAWHGAPNPFTLLTSVWEPCTSSNCSLYFHRAWLPPALPVLWRKMRGKKQYGGRGWQAVKSKKIYTGERWMAFSRLQSLN